MNRSGTPLVLKPDFKPLITMALIGCFLFLILQVIPGINSEASNPNLISKTEAAEAAERFVNEQISFTPDRTQSPVVSYQTRSGLYGYLTKESQLEQYNKQYKDKYPYDVYRVRFEQPDGTALNIDVHMQTGAISGFIYDLKDSSYKGALLQGERVRQQMLLAIEGDMTLTQKQTLAEPWVVRAGYNPSKLTLVTQEGDPGLIYRDPSASVGDAVLELKFTYENNQLRSYEPGFSVPAAHTQYVERQTLQATLLTFLGYGLLTLVLGKLSIVYSVKTRAHTSFKRGIFLAILVFIIQMLNVYNLMPLYESEGMSSSMIRGVMLFYGGYSLIFSALVYFALVGGSGLWQKENSLNPWPRSKEPGYGRYVLQSMKLGYLWAFILMGVQSIIFVVLGLTLNTWSTTDAEQSPYNMLYPFLFPLMAWLAGIMEEAVFRMFGIKMLKKIFRSTFAASLISSIIWALGHTLYPIYPIISRPIELVVIGLLFSFIFLRYGYLAVMFAHVVFNSILMGFSLAMMSGTANLLTGIFYMLLPAIVGLVIFKYHQPKQKSFGGSTV
ncbi:CPBP family intramembrane glutamic endopeptidase [Paenibacillus lemnae]|uniref:CPBP family intramembrane metalloprotease n=1 Tax=Paenibacillus lemnae TaxID=1330551 RepID=A0A848M601_PAELE|nr:CPBP family intramembrane glutamic endopeptidase [Paenibacillus lemnae]NMO95651.1 CPBP family intramembrane metalloprotease [Paenibacillus lemnae]